MILTRADYPLQEGLKVMNAAKAIFAHAERRHPHAVGIFFHAGERARPLDHVVLNFSLLETFWPS
jgi:hypothetical protein